MFCFIKKSRLFPELCRGINAATVAIVSSPPALYFLLLNRCFNEDLIYLLRVMFVLMVSGLCSYEAPLVLSLFCAVSLFELSYFLPSGFTLLCFFSNWVWVDCYICGFNVF